MKLLTFSVVVASWILSAAVAQAHIKLINPPSRITENAIGDPQKAFPCGGNAQLSRVRTKFRPGQTIMVEWSETIHHPGHFRIAFDDDGTDAFRDPSTATDIVMNPALPILADGLFPTHAVGQRLMQPITLPNVVCRTCTLQIIQVMTDKAPYMPNGAGDDMYYHCADIELGYDAADGGASDGRRPDAGVVRDGARPPDTRPPGSGGTGGSAGTGGSSGTGGSAGTGGGAPAGSGGRGGGSPAPAPAPAPGGDEAGGFCSIGGRDQRPAFALAFLALAGAFLRRTRRRR